MAYHGVLIPRAIMATNIDSLNRNVVDVADIDNGHVFIMGARSTRAGEAEVFEISQPETDSLDGLWMAYQGDQVVWTGNYKGLDPDVRNFYNKAGYVFSAYKPQVADIILISADGLAGTFIAGTTTHVNATSGAWALTWGNSQTASALSYKLLSVSYISLATGGIDAQRQTAYILECVHN